MTIAPGRRALLAGAASLLPAVSGLRAARADDASPGLNAMAVRGSRFFGSAIDAVQMASEPDLMAHIPIECGMVVGEYVFKWAALHPDPHRYTFAAPEALMAFARSRHQRVRGHTLVWHESNPPWLVDALANGGDAERILVDHIHNVAGHFQGRIAQWDVVNEAVDPADGAERGLRRTLWLQAMGPRYLDVAFTTCALTDPSSLRVLNEFGIDYAIPWQERKRGALLGVLADLVARGIPVQAVGMQGHLDAAEMRLDQRVLAQFADDVASLGLSIVVTEMDVRDDKLPADIAIRDAAVAAHARAWLEPILESPATLGVMTWGLSDRRSWLDTTFPRADGLQQRPLPLDENLRRTPLWQAIRDTLDTTRLARARGSKDRWNDHAN